MEDLLSIKETAKALRMSESFVYQEAREGKITCVKFGSKTYFKQRHIDEYVERMTKPCQHTDAKIEEENGGLDSDIKIRMAKRPDTTDPVGRQNGKRNWQNVN